MTHLSKDLPAELANPVTTSNAATALNEIANAHLTQALAMIVTQPDGHETLMRPNASFMQWATENKCKVVLLGDINKQPSPTIPFVWRKVMQELVSHIERNTCEHESTHRGGFIWEICDQCGQMWADDLGGKPEFKWPDVVEAARLLLNPAPEKAHAEQSVDIQK